MERLKPSQKRKLKGQTKPDEPNLIPIMNLFLTIIPMIMFMVAVSQIALVALNFTDSGGPGGGSGGGSGSGEKEKTEIHIMGAQFAAANQFLGMEIREPGRGARKISAINQNYDYPTLDLAIKDIRSRNAELKDITVLVYPDVLYGDLMKTIDLCKANGFTQVHYTRPKVQYY